MASKLQNFGKTRAEWEKRLFIQVYVTLKLIELVEISHMPADFFILLTSVIDKFLIRSLNKIGLMPAPCVINRWSDTPHVVGLKADNNNKDEMVLPRNKCVCCLCLSSVLWLVWQGLNTFLLLIFLRKLIFSN